MITFELARAHIAMYTRLTMLSVQQNHSSVSPPPPSSILRNCSNSYSSKCPSNTSVKSNQSVPQWKKLIENSVRIKLVLFLAPYGTPARPAPAKEGIDKWPAFEASISKDNTIEVRRTRREMSALADLCSLKSFRPYRSSDNMATEIH